MITDLFYAHIIKINRHPLHTKSFRHTHFSIFKTRLTLKSFASPKNNRGIRETGPSGAIMKGG